VPTVTETITAYDPACRTLTYQATAGMPAFVTTARNRWQVTPVADRRAQVTVDELDHRRDHAQRGLGNRSNRPVRKRSVTTVSAATTSPDTWERAPAAALTAVLDKLPVDDHPSGQRRTEVRGAQTDQFPVGVD